MHYFLILLTSMLLSTLNLKEITNKQNHSKRNTTVDVIQPYLMHQPCSYNLEISNLKRNYLIVT